MDQLFDSLSEDWVSQPRSPHSEQARQSPPVAGSPAQLSNGSQSRIPRIKSRTSSRLSTDSTASAQRATSIALQDSIKQPLREKTPSNLNTHNNKPHRKDAVKLADAAPKANRSHKKKVPVSSPPPIPQDTVQHKVSPSKPQNSHGTPEWKRRLGSNRASNEQPDLFSPIGLQNVFKPPTVKGKGEQKKGKNHHSNAADEVPSSPPSQSIQSPATRIGKPRQQATQTSDTVNRAAEKLQDMAHRGSDAIEQYPGHEGGAVESSQVPDGHLQDQTDKHTAADREASGSSSDRSGTATPRMNGPDQCHEDSVLLDTIAERSRVTSGQTEDYNEGLSPFYVSRQHTVDGRIDYAAVIDTEQVLQRMQNMMLQNKQRPTSRSSDRDIGYAGASTPKVTVSQQCPSSDRTSHSLPDDLSTGTESFMLNGGFVNRQRGGHSQEGSFMRKPLSPSSSPSVHAAGSSHTSTARRSLSGSSSRSLLAKREAADHPSTPKGNPMDEASSERPRSSGSPLKLFGLYDTYTNDRLSRRMSKFEETMSDSAGVDDDLEDKEGIDSPEDRSRAFSASGRNTNAGGKRPTSRFSSFGEGELDNHPFDSYRPLPSQDLSERPRDVPVPKRIAGQFTFEAAADQFAGSTPKRKRKKYPSTSTAIPDDAKTPDLENERKIGSTYDDQPQEVVQTAHGKRLPNSPPKVPQSKRRRTLLESELNLNSIGSPLRPEVNQVLKSSVVGRKRKDALYETSTQTADPNVLATRHILRPRNPTPSQSGHPGLHGTNASAAFRQHQGHHQISGVSRLNESEPAVDAPTERLAEELASLALNVAQDMSDEVRKPSVTTADFFNEAQQIMQLIRARGRPPSSHISEEEPAADAYEDDYDHDSKLLDSTKDEFSRPPSREGGSMRRLREPAQVDARIISQLRKFEEDEDIDMALSSSLKSLKVARSAENPSADVRNAVQEDDAHLESDSNIRILGRTKGTHKRKQSPSATEVPLSTTDAQPQSFGSHSTSGPSTQCSIPSSSSRGSRNRAIIAPETVAHLLSDQVAGMTFDHEKQIWVKSRNSSKAEGSCKKGSNSSEITDGDLLGEIPDLSVDEIEELRRIKVVDYPSERLPSASDRISNHDHAILDAKSQPSAKTQASSNSRPQTANSQQTGLGDVSSAPSKYSHFASSNLVVPETRTTSWGDEAFARKVSGKGAANQGTEPPRNVEHGEEVEHEISISEGRVSRTPNRGCHRQPRVVTVAFSSPLVDQIETSYLHEEGSHLLEDDDDPDLEDSARQYGGDKKTPSSARRLSIGFRRGSIHQSASRRRSIGQQNFIARPMSRLDEHEELSIVHCSNGVGMNVALSTPLNRHSLAVPRTSGHSSSIGFRLSPLPDFTVHQIDRPLDRSVLASGQGSQALQRRERRVSLSTQEIVKKITDVEPYEPYWEYLRAIDFRDRGMLTLHMLSDFCARLEELDVSNNQLGELNGAPSSIRYLNVRRNCLSSLTAWGHLYNLQYLDVSENQLTSLRGFQSLMHLRELKADDNQIENLEGVFALDGLINLSLKRNRIGWVDFKEANL